jgi:hypothetical protein
MNMEFSAEEISSAERQWTRLLASCDDTALMGLCETRSKGVLPTLSIAAEAVTTQIEKAARNHVPLSLIRVGDAEGTALYLREADASDRLALKCFNFSFKGQTGVTLGFDDAKPLCGQIAAALLDADIAGFRSLDRGFRGDESSVVARLVRNCEIRSALGMMGARRFLEAETKKGSFQHSTMTSMWIHLALIPYIERICAASSAVLVISGCNELAQEFERRLGSRFREFVSIPRQVRQGREVREVREVSETHYFKHFPLVMEKLRGDLRGVLVLVGAGLLGKIYCHAAKTSGAVAVDLGSAFDILANKVTRRIHRELNVAALRWL